ncbi:NifU-like N terminal domain-containing protein [Phascolomyces articulosus]|uniref:NifU-like N terminal domain-containing protein n=1 Tax=Phascolomyces articulosus TaxID=60185 RepID=A0AAD5KKK6_9FUNG|nr:NifU-like N terminal domain-containing protein [Phascolomyces articulosus]
MSIFMRSQQVRNYHKKVVDHFSRRENVGFLDKPNHTGLVGAPASADVLRLQVQVDLGNGKIMDPHLNMNKRTAMDSTIHNSAFLSETVRGLSFADKSDHMTIKDKARKLPFPPVKLHCSVMAEESIQSAINSYFATRHG